MKLCGGCLTNFTFIRGLEYPSPEAFEELYLNQIAFKEGDRGIWGDPRKSIVVQMVRAFFDS